ncbi:MAG: SGNH/GDSL hydrolase family protein [Planctomycetota bacterium]
MLTRRNLIAAGLGAAALDPSVLARPATRPAADLAAGPAARSGAGPRTPRDVTWQTIGPEDTEGRGWRDTTLPFDRLPARAELLVPPAVWRLSRHSSGISFEFEGDARALHVRYKLTSGTLAMPHMPATGVSGIDLYGIDLNGADSAEGAAPRWRWASVYRPNAQLCEGPLIENIDEGHRRWRAYLPLYNGVESLELGAPEGAALKLIAPRRAQPIVFYGTSILHGACASRPGMAWPSIVGRRLARPTINLGFSGSGKMEPALADLLAELDAAAFVIDCAPNMSPEMITERAAALVERIRAARPSAPIVLVEDRRLGYGWVRASARQRNAGNAEALRATHRALLEHGVTGLAYVEAERLLGADFEEAMTDGSHPNDLGMTRYADALTPVLASLLGA